MDLSVAPHIPLFVASGASIWRARNVLVGSTFESWVRMSADGLELLEATEAIFVEQQYWDLELSSPAIKSRALESYEKLTDDQQSEIVIPDLATEETKEPPHGKLWV